VSDGSAPFDKINIIGVRSSESAIVLNILTGGGLANWSPILTFTYFFIMNIIFSGLIALTSNAFLNISMVANAFGYSSSWIVSDVESLLNDVVSFLIYNKMSAYVSGDKLAKMSNWLYCLSVSQSNSDVSLDSKPIFAPVKRYQYSSYVISLLLSPTLEAIKKLNTNLCSSNTARLHTLNI